MAQSGEVVVYAALGTNLGDKLRNLEAAVGLLNTLAGRVLATSRLFSTAPQYVADQPPFFNIVLRLVTSLAPAALLEVFKRIERDVGRVESFRYGPRLIDVDVLFYGDAVVTTETADGPLVVPHERIAERDFVLAPFCDLAPEFVHPGLQLPMRALYDRLLASHAGASALAPPVPLLPVDKAAPWQLGAKTFVMGIVNVTPDSFSDSAELATVDAAVARALEMAREGVDIVDIGGESTRPGAAPVSEAEELRRVLPVIAGIRAKSAVPISIDTTKAAVARQAVAAGANVVNDVSAGLQDADMLATVAQLRVPTMTGLKQYEDVVTEVAQELNERVGAAVAAGIFSWNIIVDPGIGFAKAGELNLQLLRGLASVKAACGGLPLLVGASRKGFIGAICGRPDPKDRAWGTAATCCAAIAQGVDLLRVHDSPAMVDVAKMSDAIWRRAA
ncbi:hypothetical protein PybrP1_007606 [[Pythium] brassicae (nom. inval.)]|nr:hypothetical protein PybrP1_007606 [[Pythium] brassicae (nom. inval.)]